jgi:SAM-dependent methyltransferase
VTSVENVAAKKDNRRVDQGEIWNDLVGNAWIRHAATIDAHGAVFGRAAMDALGTLTGQRVLDVGCGTGETTFQLAERTGPEGGVVGLDLSAGMIEHARRRTRGVRNVEFVLGDATTARFGAAFDAIYSRSGVMFFDDPVAAFARLRGCVVDGGRLAFSAWADPLSNPWMSVPVLASTSVLRLHDLPGPGRPGPFAFASEEIVRSTLTSAGWSGVTCEELRLEQPYAAGDAPHSAAVMVEVMPPLAAGLVEQPDKRDALIDAITEALAPYERDGDVVMEATAWIVSASTS